MTVYIHVMAKTRKRIKGTNHDVDILRGRLTALESRLDIVQEYAGNLNAEMNAAVLMCCRCGQRFRVTEKRIVQEPTLLTRWARAHLACT